MGKRFSHNASVASASRRLAAMKKYVTGRKVTIPLAGKLLTPAQVAAIFQDILDTQAAVARQLAAYKGAITARDAAETRRLAADAAMKSWILQLFGDRTRSNGVRVRRAEYAGDLGRGPRQGRRAPPCHARGKGNEGEEAEAEDSRSGSTHRQLRARERTRHADARS